MRENRTYGSEGGAVLINPSLPLSGEERMKVEGGRKKEICGKLLNICYLLV